jgi:PadR family transcriptional regulator, regulatory protein PadR
MMADVTDVRVTPQTAAVLKVLVDGPEEGLYGLEIAQVVGYPAGSVYAILLRLENAGWVTSEWEDVDPSLAGRPLRRYYRLTDGGLWRAHDSLRAAEEKWIVLPRVFNPRTST